MCSCISCPTWSAYLNYDAVAFKNPRDQSALPLGKFLAQPMPPVWGLLGRVNESVEYL